ncbi:MAG: DUF2339 domain-containing protein [Cellvibrio sp.]
MVLIIVGVLVGIGAGALWFGYDGWIIGAFIGALAGMVFKQAQRIGFLESAVKTLTEDQTLTKQQLKILRSNLAASPELKNNQPPEPVKPINESPAVTPVVISKPQAATPVINSAELELPDDELAALALSHPAPENFKVPPTPVQQQAAPKPKPAAAEGWNQPAPTKASQPREPDLGDKIAIALRRFFTEGNPIVRIGMVIMFFGVSFLVKYAAGQGLFPIEFRLTGVVLGAIALLVFGWKTRLRPGSYGLVLQGGGIAILYLTLFAAAKIYGLIPLGLAFGLLFVVVIFGVLLAVLQNAQVLAVLATAGGFLAPILTSSGSGNHVGLFSFYLILNLGILSIAYYKAWRLLNWVGFMFTFVITTAWGVLKYEPALYSTSQPFLIAFFALYLLVSILFSFKQPTNLKGMVDGSLVFGLPLVGFGLQTMLLKHTEHGLAISAVVLAAIYILLAIGLARRYLQSHRVLIESFLALGVSFATLAVPLALDASWTSVTWALEATGLIWVGLRQARLRARFVGYLLHCAAVASLIIVEGIETGDTPVLSGDFLGLVLLALTSLTIAYLLFRYTNTIHSIEKALIPLALGFGILWWFIAGLNEFSDHILSEYMYSVSILFATATAVAFMLVSKKLDWRLLDNSVFALLPFIYLLSLIALADNDTHPTQISSLLALVTFFAIQYRFLFNRERNPLPTSGSLLSLWHIFTAWGVFLLIFWEVSWQKQSLNLHGTASLMMWFAAIVVPAVILIGAGQKKFWPFVTFNRDYKNWIPAPLFLLAAFWFFSVCHKTFNDSAYYLPLLNPLDLAQFAIMLVFAYAAKREFMDALGFISNAVRVAFLGVMLFVWINVVTLRAMSHYQQIPYDFDSLWNAVQVQMALSILWSVCALLVMNLSRRIQRRELWMIGAGLLGFVVLKLVTKDLSGSGTLSRIVSFMVVGALMLLIGFLSPIPAKQSAAEVSDQEGDKTPATDNKGSSNE